MNPFRIAIWHIERRLGEALSLDEIAEAAGLSRRHLARGFAFHVGTPVIAYARARRLSEAAKALRDPELSILSVALAFGYGSHEAFTRAFTDHFQVSPSETREPNVFNQLILQEAFNMTAAPASKLLPAKIVKDVSRRIVGLKERYQCGAYGGIPEQWARLRPHLGNMEGERGDGVAYGVCFNFDDGGDMDYLCGVETKSGATPLGGFSLVELEAGDYAVFAHQGHVSSIGATWRAIYADGLPSLGRKPANAPQFERMDSRFDPETGSGLVEIWIPLDLAI